MLCYVMLCCYFLTMINLDCSETARATNVIRYSWWCLCLMFWFLWDFCYYCVLLIDWSIYWFYCLLVSYYGIGRSVFFCQRVCIIGYCAPLLWRTIWDTWAVADSQRRIGYSPLIFLAIDSSAKNRRAQPCAFWMKITTALHIYTVTVNIQCKFVWNCKQTVKKLTFINQRNGRVTRLRSSWMHAYSKA